MEKRESYQMRVKTEKKRHRLKRGNAEKIRDKNVECEC
jgi:hypothetical protein